MDKELIYVADPMCSWCWGFSPVMQKLADLIRSRAALRVLPGGLRMDSSYPLSEFEAREIMQHWQEVARRTGQPFDFSRPLDASYVYNTGPSCKALSLVAHERPSCALDYLRSLQQAFYVGRRDLKDPEVLADYARTYGFTRANFIEALDLPATREALEQDIHFVRRCGIEGYPSVLLRSGARVQRLTIGYQTYEVLEPHVLRWLDEMTNSSG